MVTALTAASTDALAVSTSSRQTETSDWWVGSRLAQALDAARIPCAIGAIALAIWPDPRGTYDVDINPFIDHAGLDGALDVLTAIDVGYVRRWVVDRMGEDDARVVAWDEMLRERAEASRREP